MDTVFRIIAVWAALVSGVAASDVRLVTPPTPTGRSTLQYDTWQQMNFSVANHAAEDEVLLVTTYFEGDTQQQYGRRLWVPANSMRRSSFVLKTPPQLQAGDDAFAMDAHTLVLLQSGGAETTVADEIGRRVHDHHNRLTPKSPKSLLLAEPTDHALQYSMTAVYGQTPSGFYPLYQGELPVTLDAYDGITNVVLATSRIKNNPSAMNALRSWVFSGGRLWVQLDRTGPEVLNDLLQGTATVTVLDQVELTTYLLAAPPQMPIAVHDQPIETEEPVPMLRVAAEEFRTLATVDQWPAVMDKSVGEGRVVVTTMGPQTLSHRPTYREITTRVKPRPTLLGESLGRSFLFIDSVPTNSEPAWPILAESYIGYEITSKWAVTSILLGFSGCLVVCGVWLGRTGRYFQLCLVAPVLALVAMSVLALLGMQSRGAIPPTAATVQFAEFNNRGDAFLRGARSTYRQDSGQPSIAIHEQGAFEYTSSLAGSGKRLVSTDHGDRTWENLSLAAGQQTAVFQLQRTIAPTAAVLTLDEQGMIGQLHGTWSAAAASGMLVFPSGERAAVAIGKDGQLSSGPQDVLSAGQYLTAEILDDQQRLQSQVYEQLLTGTRRLPVQPRLYYWAHDFDLNLEDLQADRAVGNTLVSLPVEFRRPVDQAEFYLPKSLIYYQSVTDPIWGSSTLFNNRERRWLESVSPDTYTTLRCSVPPALAPLTINKILVTLDLRIPGREVKIMGRRNDGTAEDILRLQSPLGRTTLEIESADLLGTNPSEILTLMIHVGNIVNAAEIEEKNSGNSGWQIERVEFEGWAQAR